MLDFNSIFHTISVPCAIPDRKFRFVDINETYLITLVATRESLLGKRILDVFLESEKRQKMLSEAFDKALASTDALLREIQYAIPGHAPKAEMHDIWWNMFFSPVSGSTSEITHVILRVKDITDFVKNRELKDAITGEMRHRNLDEARRKT